MSRFLFIIGLLLLNGCASESSSDSSSKLDLLEIMPGTWESVSIQVTVNAGQDNDSSYIFDVPEKDWSSRLGIRPIKSYYEAGNGSTYYSEYIGLDGEIQDVTRGKWYVNGDSLRLVTPIATYEYLVSFAGGKTEFRAVLDWDRDGEDDDEYLGVQRKISKYTK